MATIEVITSGKVVKDVVFATPQPMSPAGAIPPDIGFVQISTSNNRGSIWMTGIGDPTAPAGAPGDMYLDTDTGNVWRWDGSQWVFQGTFAPSTDTPAEVLAKLITVDGAGSLLDADFLDGHDSPYFATAAGLASTQGEVDAAEARLDSVESVNTQQTTDIALKANIASPTFTGDPKAPTPATTDNDTSIATTAYVKANIATIPPNDWASIPGKPATFPPTLPINESDVTNLVSDLALKAPLASPVFTGDPRAPTPATADNDTSLATTAYVKANLATIVGGAIVSDTPPAGPAVGQLWFESDSGNTFIWYSDADSSQWLQVNVQPASAPSPVLGLTAETRSRIVNGAMQISQENGDNGSAVAGYYPADQWACNASGMTAFSSVRSGGAPDRFIYINATKATLAAGDYAYFQQKIEGIRVNDFRWGTASAVAVVLRFDIWSQSVAGIFSASLQNSAQNRSYAAPFTVPLNVWTTITLRIPGDTTGTWLTDTGAGVILNIVPAMGSTYVGVDGWQAGAKFASPSATNGFSVNNLVGIRAVGLYMDSQNTGVPPRWTMPDEAQELAACQRYWQTVEANGFGWTGYALSGQTYYARTVLLTQMRAAVPAATGASVVAAGFPATTGTLTASATTVSEARVCNATGDAKFFASNANINARM